ncbi:MAG TPA: hypothetical protein VFP68_17135 [Burkholderiaceae bacterium]|nr:hypothetical protein [Burkholderiaceae bacterium]
MPEDRLSSVPLGPVNPAAAGSASAGGTPAVQPGDAYGALRSLGATGHQLRAVVYAADRFLTLEAAEDHDTGAWLISCALDLAGDVTVELDSIARGWKQRPPEGALSKGLQALRTRAHQLHAAVRAADHFLDEESSDDGNTGSWLVACALGLAEKLAGEIEDFASRLKPAGNGGQATAAPSSQPAVAPMAGIRPFSPSSEQAGR